MWEQFMNCFKKGAPAKGCTAVELVDLYKRVPPNQRNQFKEFAKKNEEYKIRLRKYPSKMPAIDWKYYEQNVRTEMVDWVREFEKKYDKLDSMFANRHALIDHSKYFGEVAQQTEEVKEEVKKFKEESEKRIKVLEGKMEQLKCMKPYTEMTMEEFCYAHPDEAPDFINRPTFWPHTPEEQKPGPSGEIMHEPKEDPDASGDKKKPKKEPSEPPPKAPPTGSAPKGGKSKAPANAEKEEPKDLKEQKSTPPKDEEKPKEAVKAKVEQSNTESQAVDKASELLSKGVVLAKELTSKAIVLFKGLWQKAAEKRKQEKKPVLLAADSAPKPRSSEQEDSILSREGSSDICNKTIIRGEDTAKADVKPHHVDLEIEGEQDNGDKARANAEEEKCKRKMDCKEEAERPDDEKICIDLAESEKESTSPCEDNENKKPLDKCPTSALHQGGSIRPINISKIQTESSAKAQQKPNVMISNKANPFSFANQKSQFVNQMKPDNVSTNQAELKNVRAKTPQVVNPGKQVHPVVMSEKDTRNRGKNESIKCLPSTEITGTDARRPTVSSQGDVSDSDQKKPAKVNPEEVAKYVFDMATNAASLLSEAKKMIEDAQSQSGAGNDAMESAYKLAASKVTEASAMAQKAFSSARALVKQEDSLNEPVAVALIEKHALLAKLLTHRAVTMKKEITNLLAALKKH